MRQRSENVKQEILFSGIGGQGVITIGEIVCYAAAKAEIGRAHV